MILYFFYNTKTKMSLVWVVEFDSEIIAVYSSLDKTKICLNLLHDRCKCKGLLIDKFEGRRLADMYFICDKCSFDVSVHNIALDVSPRIQ